MQPWVVQSTQVSSDYPASNVLILGETDEWSSSVSLGVSGKYNFWLAKYRKTSGQGFTLRLDDCARLIAGCQIKNKGKGLRSGYSTKAFKVKGSMNENGPWETLVEDQLAYTSNWEVASLLDFTFEKPVEIQFLKFDLISYWEWGSGGGLQYFAAIPGTSKKHQSVCMISIKMSLNPQGGPSDQTTTTKMMIMMMIQDPF